MLEIGIFNNGASSLPIITTPDGITLNDGTLREESMQSCGVLMWSGSVRRPLVTGVADGGVYSLT